MDNHLIAHRESILDIGFTILEDVYTPEEVESILAIIEDVDPSNPAFRKTDDLFAIRQFLKEVPQSIPLIFNHNLKTYTIHNCLIL